MCDTVFSSQGPHVVSTGMLFLLLGLGSLAPVTACSTNPFISASALSRTAREYSLLELAHHYYKISK